jgi:uncharacterized protein YjiS (DUF1127 family)
MADKETARTTEMIMSTFSNAILTRDSVGSGFASGISGAMKRWWMSYMNWRVQQLAATRLRSMSDRELKDIGMSRSQIEFAVNGKLERPSMFRRTY